MRIVTPAPLTCLVLALLSAPGPAQVASLQRVSVDPAGNQADGPSHGAAISADGHWVAFVSEATNLVGGDTNGVADVFLRDVQGSVTARVSVASSGAQATGPSLRCAVSGDGRWVAFTSDATDLVAGDTNAATDVFLHDTQTAATTRVSIDSFGNQANGGSDWLWLSPDGRWVAFDSVATNLIAGDTNAGADVFLHDTQSGQTQRLSVATGGGQGDGASTHPDLTPDARFAVFESVATSLVAGDTNAASDVFLHDRFTGQTQRVSVDCSGNEANGPSTWAAISANGSWIAFASEASNLEPLDANGVADVFVHYRPLLETRRIPRHPHAPPDLASGTPTFTGDGTHLMFSSEATTFDWPPINGVLDVFVVGPCNVATALSVEPFLTTPGNAESRAAPLQGLSQDGWWGVFDSDASDLVAGDTNGVADVFLAQPAYSCPSASTCPPSKTSIPCCEVIAIGNGLASVSNPTGFTISAYPAPGGNVGIALFTDQGTANMPLGTQGGSLCVRAPFFRAPVKLGGGTQGTCTGVFTYTLQDLMGSAGIVVPGATIDFEAWFRDPPSPDGFGLSSGLQFDVAP